jgi:hypothetical protein
MALAPVAIAIPSASTATAVTAFTIAEAKYHAAVARYESLPENLEFTDEALFKMEENKFHAAVVRVDATPCANVDEFMRAFLIACDEGLSIPNERAIAKLARDALRIRSAR